MRRLTPLYFLAPALVVLGIFSIYPMIFTVYMSLYDWRGLTQSEFLGLGNYLKVFGSRDFLNPNIDLLRGPAFGSLIHTLIWTAVMVPLSMLMGLFLAVLLRRIRGGQIVKSLIFLGMVTPLVVGGLLILFIYDTNAGIVNGFLRAIGLGSITRSWTIHPDTSLYALILGSVWIWTGFTMIVYSAGLENIPDEMYEAARIDGASKFRAFLHITVPLLKPATITSFILTSLTAFRIFDIVFVATEGGPGGATLVVALQMFNEAFRTIPNKFGTGAALGTFLTLLVVPFALYLIRTTRK